MIKEGGEGGEASYRAMKIEERINSEASFYDTVVDLTMSLKFQICFKIEYQLAN